MESVQAYTVQLNYEGEDVYEIGASRSRSALTIGAVTTGLCVATNQYDTVSCAVLGGLVSIPFASAECQETVELDNRGSRIRERENEIERSERSRYRAMRRCDM